MFDESPECTQPVDSQLESSEGSAEARLGAASLWARLTPFYTSTDGLKTYDLVSRACLKSEIPEDSEIVQESCEGTQEVCMLMVERHFTTQRQEGRRGGNSRSGTVEHITLR